MVNKTTMDPRLAGYILFTIFGGVRLTGHLLEMCLLYFLLQLMSVAILLLLVSKRRA